MLSLSVGLLCLEADNRGEPSVDIPLPNHLLALALPYLQGFLIVMFTIASHMPSATVAIFIASYNPGPIGRVVAACTAISLQSQIMGRLNAKLQVSTKRSHCRHVQIWHSSSEAGSQWWISGRLCIQSCDTLLAWCAQLNLVDWLLYRTPMASASLAPA